ncbi:hypothetical protein O6H91_06G102700 [Diphasiastrum complanatum]|nr:hypothetical protein O6H91_06G102700 [Diphasiastrum complanatum]
MAMARATLPFLVLVSVALLIATYNTITIVSNHRATTSSHYFDTIISTSFRSGSLVRRPAITENKKKRLFHVAVTATSEPYNRWQCRIMYYWYKKLKDQAGSEMGGFTRVLHTGKPDQLMDEIPTFVVDPLPPGTDKGYIVLNRPWAFVQWLQKTDVEEDYIFMAEPDHLIMKPIPNLATQENPAAFPFFYITPKEYEAVIRKFYPDDKGPVTNIDPIGNAPVIIQKSHLKKIAPTWHNVSLRMKEDAEADKAFGWVLEM